MAGRLIPLCRFHAEPRDSHAAGHLTLQLCRQTHTAGKRLASWRALRKGGLVTREQVVSAAATGIPFILRMADGKEYSVPHRDYLSIPPKGSYVIVYDDHGRFNVLPLLTMTGLESKVTEEGAE